MTNMEEVKTARARTVKAGRALAIDHIRLTVLRIAERGVHLLIEGAGAVDTIPKNLVNGPQKD